MVPDIVNPFFPAVVKAVEGALYGREVGLFLCDAGESSLLEAKRLSALLARQVDGVLISPVDEVQSKKAVVTAVHSVPLVQVDRCVAVQSDMVAVDNALGTRLLIEHLVDQGCSSFAFVTTAARLSPTRERLEAYEKAVLEVDEPSSRRVIAGELTVQWGREAARRLLSEGGLPDAVVCANDMIAVGVLGTLSAAGVRVPADVAISGYDDSILAENSDPPLTSIRQPLELLGEEAVRLLLSGIDDRSLPARAVKLSPELVVRRSTLPRPSGRRGGGRRAGRARSTGGRNADYREGRESS